MTPLGLLIFGLLSAGDSVPGSAAVRTADEPAIRLWINNSRQFREGEKAKRAGHGGSD